MYTNIHCMSPCVIGITSTLSSLLYLRKEQFQFDLPDISSQNPELVVLSFEFLQLAYGSRQLSLQLAATLWCLEDGVGHVHHEEEPEGQQADHDLPCLNAHPHITVWKTTTLVGYMAWRTDGQMEDMYTMKKSQKASKPTTTFHVLMLILTSLSEKQQH